MDSRPAPDAGHGRRRRKGARRLNARKGRRRKGTTAAPNDQAVLDSLQGLAEPVDIKAVAGKTGLSQHTASYALKEARWQRAAHAILGHWEKRGRPKARLCAGQQRAGSSGWSHHERGRKPSDVRDHGSGGTQTQSSEKSSTPEQSSSVCTGTLRTTGGHAHARMAASSALRRSRPREDWGPNDPRDGRPREGMAGAAPPGSPPSNRLRPGRQPDTPNGLARCRGGPRASEGPGIEPREP